MNWWQSVGEIIYTLREKSWLILILDPLWMVTSNQVRWLVIHCCRSNAKPTRSKWSVWLCFSKQDSSNIFSLALSVSVYLTYSVHKFIIPQGISSCQRETIQLSSVTSEILRNNIPKSLLLCKQKAVKRRALWRNRSDFLLELSGRKHETDTNGFMTARLLLAKEQLTRAADIIKQRGYSHKLTNLERKKNVSCI